MTRERKLLQWAAAVSTAFAAHVLLIVGYAGLTTYGAAGEGQGGIEIGLGMLGEMGESLETSDAAELAELPREQLPEAPPEPADPQPEAPSPEPEPVQQITEVAVQTETSEELTEVVVETDTSEPIAHLQPIEREIAGGASAPSEGGSTGNDAVTQRRQSSGTGSSTRAGGSRGRQAAYVATLAAQLNRKKHYPMAARRARQEGTATLSLVIQRDGTVSDFSISESSGWEALDAAVLRMLERAQPLPAFPASISEEELRVKIPVSFSLNPL